MRLRSLVGLSAALVVALTACGSDNNSAPGDTANVDESVAVDCAGKTRLSAEGSSAQKNAIDTFVQAFQQRCPGFDLAYNASGSGGGVRQFIAGQVDFGGSDSPLSAQRGEVDRAAQRCQNNPAWHLPLVFGPIALGYRLDGITDLTLDGATTAKIFSGAITKWNDPAIVALNSGITLPNKDIKVIYRSDESGTTDNFQQYLTAASAGAWNKGAGKQFAGGVGNGQERSAGVAQAAGSIDGAITYVELSFAQDNNLSIAKINNGSGAVPLNDQTVGQAIDNATIKGQGNDLIVDLNSIYASTAQGSYPLLLTTYEIVCSKGYDAETTSAVKAFLTVAATNGQVGLSDAGYAPLPSSFKEKLLTAIQAIS